MHIEDLSVNGFRNLRFNNVKLCKGVNIFYGSNGSGKTSILESVFYMSRSKSFRTNRKLEIINSDSGSFSVFSKINTGEALKQLGCSLDEKGNSKIRLDGNDVKRVSEVVSLLPVQVITPESFDVFWKSPKFRRSFFDFGLFHVEHSFFSAWKDFSKVYKQVSSLLRSERKNRDEIQYWYKMLNEKSTIVEQYRQNFVNNVFNSAIETVKNANASEENPIKYLIQGLSVKYRSRNLVKDEDVVAQIEKDLRYKQIGFGPNRADYHFLSFETDISKLVSRGQSKLIFYLLTIVMVNLVKEKSGKNVVLLIDDLPSEVDVYTRNIMTKMIVETGSQVLVTSIENDLVKEFQEYTNLTQVFHVEHGTINNKNMEQLCP